MTACQRFTIKCSHSFAAASTLPRFPRESTRVYRAEHPQEVHAAGAAIVAQFQQGFVRPRLVAATRTSFPDGITHLARHVVLLPLDLPPLLITASAARRARLRSGPMAKHSDVVLGPSASPLFIMMTVCGCNWRCSCGETCGNRGPICRECRSMFRRLANCVNNSVIWAV